jgi:hypothetical protein
MILTKQEAARLPLPFLSGGMLFMAGLLFWTEYTFRTDYMFFMLGAFCLYGSQFPIRSGLIILEAYESKYSTYALWDLLKHQ